MLFSVHRDGNLQLNVTIFRPYGRKTSVIIPIFRPYGWKIAEFSAWFPSLRTEIKRWISLFSVRTYRWSHIIAQSSSTNQI